MRKRTWLKKKNPLRRSLDFKDISSIGSLNSLLVLNNDHDDSLLSYIIQYTELIPVYLKSSDPLFSLVYAPSPLFQSPQLGCSSFSSSTPLIQSPQPDCSSSISFFVPLLESTPSGLSSLLSSPLPLFNYITLKESEAEMQANGLAISNLVTYNKESYGITIVHLRPKETKASAEEINSERQGNLNNNVNAESTGTFILRPKRGQKRKIPKQNQQQRKKNCIQNKDYVNQHGNLCEEKEFHQYLCKCNCFDKVGE